MVMFGWFSRLSVCRLVVLCGSRFHQGLCVIMVRLDRVDWEVWM